MLSGWKRRVVMPTREQALAGRAEPMPLSGRHLVHGRPLRPPFPEGLEPALFGLGCFWGASRHHPPRTR